MRITIVTGPFFSVPPAPCGALERLWFDLAREFAAAGHVVTVLCRAWPGLPDDQTVAGVRVIRRSQYRQTRSFKINLVKDLFYSLAMTGRLPHADITVVNSFWLPILAVYRWRAGRIIFNVSRWPKGQIKLYRKVARLAATSTPVRDEIIRQTPAAATRTRVLPNPIDTAIFSPPATPRAQRSEPKTILYTGRVTPEKGVHLLIQAFKILAADDPTLRLRIVGPTAFSDGGGGDEYLSALKKDAGNAHVEFHPAIYDRVQLADALRAADVYCYPSLADRGESFGVAPLEAMATGMAPIVSNLAVFRDFLTDGVNGWAFDHHDPEPAQRLAEALRQPLASPTLADQMGQAARAAAEKFSYPNVVKMYLDDFHELLASPAPTKAAS